MNNFSEKFQLFLKAFNNNEALVSIGYLNEAFLEDRLRTLNKLYSNKLLSNPLFLKMAIDNSTFDKTYILLFQLCLENINDITQKEKFIKTLSKEQLLQGFANFIEKNNVELKYNQKWNERHAKGNSEYLETERQSIYSTYSGIIFQEILNLYYENAPINHIENIQWNTNSENQYLELIHCMNAKINLLDCIERVIFFKWDLAVVNENTLKILAPENIRESKPGIDLINTLKSKYFLDNVEVLADYNLAKNYHSGFVKPNLEKHDYYLNTIKNEHDLEWYENVFYKIDLKADLTVEKELAFYQQKYFPGIEEFNEIELLDNRKLNLRNTFRITSFFAEWSKQIIEQIDKQYNGAVNYFHNNLDKSDNYKEIERLSKVYQGDSQKLKEMLNQYNNEGVYFEQQKIISKAKEVIENKSCLVKIEIKNLIKTLQWISDLDKDSILKIIEMYTFKNEDKSNVVNCPFFQIGEFIYWMPNMIAFNLFSEKLIENLISKKLISIHRFQTEYFERNLNYIFKKHGYKTILKKECKIIKDSKGRDIGDFDVLAYKNGKLIHMQLKLTSSRNSYQERYSWKTMIKKASEQLEIGNKFIKENPEKIAEILSLNDNDKIDEIQSFIISNSFLFDHETLYGFYKLSCFEAMSALYFVNELNRVDSNLKIDFGKFITENMLFNQFENLPVTYADAKLKIGNFNLLLPTLIQQNLYTSLC